MYNCTDIDGYTYPTVKIGKQLWMASNLRVTRYRNGDPIPLVESNDEWVKLRTGARCFPPENSLAYYAKHGYLYNWHAVNDPRGLAPDGWHVPTNKEMETWNDTQSRIKLNLSCGGYRYYRSGSLDDIGYFGYWWSSTDDSSTYALYRKLYFSSLGVYHYIGNKRYGFSIRCVMD